MHTIIQFCFWVFIVTFGEYCFRTATIVIKHHYYYNMYVVGKPSSSPIITTMSPSSWTTTGGSMFSSDHHHHHNSSAAAVILAIEVEELLLRTFELWSEHPPCMFNADDEGNGKADTSADEGAVDLIIMLINNNQTASAEGYSPSSKNMDIIKVFRIFY
jgi:hypothetical protein